MRSNVHRLLTDLLHKRQEGRGYLRDEDTDFGAADRRSQAPQSAKYRGDIVSVDVTHGQYMCLVVIAELSSLSIDITANLSDRCAAKRRRQVPRECAYPLFVGC